MLCPTSVIGPFDFEPSLSGQMLIDFYHRKIPLLVPGGYDWVDVRDVAGKRTVKGAARRRKRRLTCYPAAMLQ